MPDDELDLSLLPEGLQSLAPLVARFAEADDVDREELLANASEAELRELSEAPTEHWDAINAFLDENVAAGSGPLQDVALAARRVSQGALEARSEIEGR